VSARASRDVIERRRKEVHHLALAFIAPLRAYNNNRLHQPPAPLRTCFRLPLHHRKRHSEGLGLARRIPLRFALCQTRPREGFLAALGIM